jgi:GNAT superfamily N-acetyltransferase
MILFKRLPSLSESDRLVITKLQRTCLPDDEPYFPDNGWWWLGLDGKQVAAFCLLTKSSNWVDTVYLARSGVLPAWRGNGLQKRMITLREKFARQQGYRWMISDTTDNLPSANSLISKGYKLYSPARPWGYDATLYWRKRIRTD